MDDSRLDTKYFIDDTVYNCPYCNRNNIVYKINEKFEYDFSNSKRVTVFLATCSWCDKVSMHTTEDLDIFYQGDVRGFYKINTGLLSDFDIDSHIFHSQPSSFFTVDERIPKKLRELISESEGCLKMNYLTGASACARKAIFELLVKEKAQGDNYSKKIKNMKLKFTDVDDAFFDNLGAIKDMTSEKIHEQSWDEWDSSHLKIIIETLKSIFIEIYVVPGERLERKKRLQALKEKILKKK